MFDLFHRISSASKRVSVNEGFSVICVSNDYDKLNKYLVSSLSRQHSPHELFIIDNRNGRYSSAAPILNQTAQRSKYDYLMFVHQDVSLLSNSWLMEAQIKLSSLKKLGAVGVAGRTREGRAGAAVIHGDPPVCACDEGVLRTTVEVQTLDGCLLIVPKKVFEQVPFDESHQGWYLYVAGYCLDLRRKGFKSYAIPNLIYHESTGPANPALYEQAVRHLVTRHKSHVDIICTTVGIWETKQDKRT